LTTELGTYNRWTMLKGVGTPSAGAITVDFGGQTQDEAYAGYYQFSGTYDVVQSNKNTSAGANSLAVTLSSFANAGNYTVSFVGLWDAAYLNETGYSFLVP